MNVHPTGPVIRGVLSPYDRASEVLFGLIMALTLTGALNVAQATERETRALFASTLSCNVAWGLVDAVMYALNQVLGRARRFLLAGELRAGADPARVLSEDLPEPLLQSLSPADLDRLQKEVLADPAIPDRPRLRWEDVLGALAVFVLVVVSTFPVALPFLLLQDVGVAMKVSRGLGLALLFLSGYAVGRYSGLSPVKVGLAMLGIGAVLVGLVTALGG
ncbi:MAG TPA: hypothetical protein VGG91_24165 [Myxococcaceae bacterium]|jgi:hypothetical protein